MQYFRDCGMFCGSGSHGGFTTWVGVWCLHGGAAADMPDTQMPGAAGGIRRADDSADLAGSRDWRFILGEVFQGQGWTVTASPLRDFPKLTAGEQSLVQMDRVDEFVLAGVRGNADGSSGSGWVTLDIGVRGVPHGNHFDWQYPAAPRVLVSALNAEQGNPAYVYVSGGRFYVANDRKNGFTVVDPKRLRKEGLGAAQFFSGGGGHITMAPVENRRVFATWIDGGGPNQGRVDVVELPPPGGQMSSWSFQLPTGVLHGAATCAGKVFFAPADGVCWVPADVSAPQ